jgi:PhzF family phenazine biosynthesis protein
MRIPIYQVDAFTSRVFGGNPAAVCPLESWLDDATLQSIATENNLAETAYFVGGGGKYEIRWMTPVAEVNLCGHATLASAWVVMNRLDRGRERVVFGSRSGPLTVVRDGELLTLDFPAVPAEPTGAASAVGEALGRAPRQVLAAARDYLALYDTEDEVRALRPDMARVAALDRQAVIASAPGKSCDFVSRFFAPALGIPEDPATGSSHCTLVPYWAGRLGQDRLRARQVSPRGGELFCEARGARVAIAGRAVPFMEGQIEIS